MFITPIIFILHINPSSRNRLKMSGSHKNHPVVRKQRVMAVQKSKITTSFAYNDNYVFLVRQTVVYYTVQY